MRGLNAIIAFLLLGAVTVVLALYVNDQAALTCRLRECSFNYPPDAVSLAAFVGLATAGLVVVMVLANLALALADGRNHPRRASQRAG